MSLSITSLQAQLEYSNWIWGDSNQLVFTANSATPQTGPSFIPYGSSPRGHASISDRNGQLLFYISADTIMDRNGDSIANGRLKNARGVSICPLPCNDSLYYVFSTAGIDNNNPVTMGLFYQIVNVRGNGGLGSIYQQSTMLDSTVNQALDFSITRHSNNTDYWIALRNKHDTNSAMHAWQITDSGIVANPVSSLYETFPNAAIYYSLNDFSPHGGYYAQSFQTSGTGGISQTRLLSFDNSTGQFQLIGTFNEANLSSPNENHSVAFSPDGSKLYCVSAYRALWQFDLSSGNASTMLNSGQDIAAYSTNFPNGMAGLRLGMNGKIYVTRAFGNNATTYLGVINNPNDTGSACNFTLDGLQCDQKTYVVLPSIIHNLFVPREIEHDSLECTSDTTTFSFDNYAYFDSAQWFIDTGAAQVMVSSDSLAQYVFDSAGVFPIMAVSYSGCRLDTFYDTVTVLLTPAPDLGPDTVLCEGDTFEISNEWQYSYLWNTGDTIEYIQILQPDTYWLELSNYCGSARDSVVVDSIIEALVIFPTDDTLLCDGDVFHLSAEVDAGTYNWFDGSTDSVNDITAADTVWAVAENACGTSTDTIQVRYTGIPEIPILDSILCLGDTYSIDLETDSLSTFLWKNGDTTSTQVITTQGQYWVKETNFCGTDRDTFQVAFVTDPIVDLGGDTVVCMEDSFSLDVSTPFGTYLWQDGSIASMLSVFDSNLAPGSNYFHVTITNACGTDRDTLLLVADLPLNIHLGPDIVDCEANSIEISAGLFDRTTYNWTGVPSGVDKNSESVSFTIPSGQDQMEARVSLTNSCGTFRDSILIFIDVHHTPELGADLESCDGDSIILNAGYAERTTYEWTSDKLNVDSVSHWILSSEALKANHPISIQVRTTNTCGSKKDDIIIKIDSLPRQSGLDTVFFCEGSTGKITLNPELYDSVYWNDGFTDDVRTVVDHTTYHLTYYNRCGVTFDTLNTHRVSTPSFTYESPVLLCEDGLYVEPEFYDPENDRYHPVYFLWSDGNQVPWNTIYEIGIYTVFATNVHGCVDSSTIQVKTCGADFYAPNSFTPNVLADQFNSYWKPVGEGLFEFDCTIFDRWGKSIFTFDESSLGWDGNSNGSPAPIGVYLWKMDMISEDFSGKQSFEGRVMLVR